MLPSHINWPLAFWLNSLVAFINSIQRYGHLMRKIHSCDQKVVKVLTMLLPDLQKPWQLWNQNSKGNSVHLSLELGKI